MYRVLLIPEITMPVEYLHTSGLDAVPPITLYEGVELSSALKAASKFESCSGNIIIKETSCSNIQTTIPTGGQDAGKSIAGVAFFMSGILAS